MSTARPRPVTEIRNSNLEAPEKASTTSKPKDVSVSHSFSVVSVKYSSSSGTVDDVEAEAGLSDETMTQVSVLIVNQN